MIDIRYHIYSLAAVFFALALGIAIGTSFAKNSSGTTKERRIIQRYENSMWIMKRELEKASCDVAQKEVLAKSSEDFCRAVLPGILTGKLAGRNVAIVQTGDYDDLSGSVKHALELAGATVTTITDISRTFDFDDSHKVACALAACGITPPDDSKQARDKLWSIIADTVYAAKYHICLRNSRHPEWQDSPGVTIG